MGLKVKRQTDLTSLFDKFATLPTDKKQLQESVKAQQDELNKDAKKDDPKK